MKTQTHQNESSLRRDQLSDADLLELFVQSRDEDAFAELVRRHCGLVVGVCRRSLRNTHDVEDVFQATFLVLARDARRIREQRSLSNWLYGVAYRLALLVSRKRKRRRESELTEIPDMDHGDILDGVVARNQQHIIDEELQSLPERYRQPFVLHHLSGRTQQEVADELGLTPGAVDGLLKRGRKELRERLIRRGIAFGAALAAIQASQQTAQAAELNGLICTTTRAGIAFTSKSPPEGAVSLRAAELAGKELATMSMKMKTMLTAGIALGASSLIGGFGLAISLAATRNQQEIPPNPARETTPKPPAVVLDGAPAVNPILVEQPIAPPAVPVEPSLVAQNTQKGADEKYTNADEAYSVGATFYNARNFKASQDPFEAALRMAPDDKYRVKVYRALLGAYRQLTEIDKFVEAADFIITKSDSSAERSLVRTDLLSFVHQRGKTNDLATRYEAVLTKDDKNVTALYILSELYADLKKDPKRSSELLEKLAKLNANSGEKLDVPGSAKLAQQYVRQGKFSEGATLYEKIAPLDKKLAAWHWKEAAQAWIKAKDNSKALAAAKAAVAAGPEKRSDQLTHFWHRALGQVFVAAGEPETAISHFEAAIESTSIEGYLKDTKSELAAAKESAGKKK